MSFENLIGNEKNKNVLTDIIKNKNILHSYLFYGVEGIGKKLFAMEFAEMILCNSSSNKPCKECSACIKFETGNNPDFFIIEPEGSSIKIDQIRKMQKTTLEKPINSSKKVYIINNADTMTKEAQNCLLKTLEEPQEYIVIILIASNENNILSTIKSRCIKMYFQNITDSEISKFIKEKFNTINFEKDMLKLCNGSISKALKIVEKLDILKQENELVNKIEELNELEIINYNEIFYNNKEDINLMLDYMYVLLFEKINANTYNKNKYINAMQIVQNTKNKLSNSNNYDMTIDSMLIKMWGEINEKHYRSKV